MKNKISINSEVSLVEIAISILIFAVAGAIMLNCFAAAKFTQIKANDKTAAGNIIQSNAEIIKSFKYSNEMYEYLNNNFQIVIKEDEIIYENYFDKSWTVCDELNKEYIVSLKVSDISTNSGELKEIYINVEKAKPYPFINKEEDNQLIFEIETKKFFYIHNDRR